MATQSDYQVQACVTSHPARRPAGGAGTSDDRGPDRRPRGGSATVDPLFPRFYYRWVLRITQLCLATKPELRTATVS